MIKFSNDFILIMQSALNKKTSIKRKAITIEVNANR